jgi:hypothetical protein
MDQERLSSLAIIQMNSIKIEKIIDIFASKKEKQILHYKMLLIMNLIYLY